ncbi:MAG: nitroreductase family protein [Ignavibacteria bacterium]|jgi:nitroreductase
MDKSANNKYEIHELIKNRWSPRSFKPVTLEKEKILSLFEAARWAPSSYNEQPWHFIIASREDEQEFDKLLSCLVEFNKEWAKDASLLIITVARSNSIHSNKPNKHAWHDIGLAAANLTIQAGNLGLYVHQIGGFDAEKTTQVFNIPEGYEPVSAIAVGYKDDPDKLNDSLKKSETAVRKRKELEEFIFEGEWGKTTKLLNH